MKTKGKYQKFRMMKFLVALCILAVVAPAVNGKLECSLGSPKIPQKWIDLRSHCLSAMRTQIQKEIEASYQYLAMGAYFSQDTVNRPGFAEMFFKSAKEEREHASKLIEYLSMRGQLTGEVDNQSNGRVTDLIKPPKVEKQSWDNAAAALEAALKLETEVTVMIRNLISTCEQKPQDYHLVDYLTGVFLEEQLHGQRELAGRLTTLLKMKTSNGVLGEFLYDKDL